MLHYCTYRLPKMGELRVSKTAKNELPEISGAAVSGLDYNSILRRKARMERPENYERSKKTCLRQGML